MRLLLVFILCCHFFGWTVATELPDFSGKWRINQGLSDDASKIFKQHVKVKKLALGSGQKKDGGGLLFGAGKQRRKQLDKLVRKLPPELVAADFVVVQQGADVIQFDYLHTQRSVRTDGRSNPILLSTETVGARDVVSGVWKIDRFEVEIVSALGAYVEEVWRILPAAEKSARAARQIEVRYILRMPLYLEQAATFRRVFDWAGPVE